MIRTAITKNGKVKGLPADDPRVTVFRGIPFAAPPVGDNRWRAPKPCEDWEGVRNCYEFGPVSMQDQPGVGNDIYCREWHVDPDIPVSEDCLYLNVWTGAKSTDEKLPVLVWIYGGAFQWGYTAEMEFNGERLARHGVIVVSIAYRLGVFGFMAHPSLTSDDPMHPTNFGLLDQKAGLEWVYENIAAFGGEPNNITLAGQSAGGASVTFALANPDAARMIQKASVFSGFIRNPFYSDDIIQPKPLRTAEANGEEFISFIGCNSVEEARNMDSVAIRDAYAEYAKTHPRFVPCIDGVYVTEDPYRMILEGKTPDLPMLAGYTKDEFADKLPARADESDLKVKADIIEKSGIRYFNVVENSVKEVAYAHMSNSRRSPLYVYRFAPSIPGYDDPGDFHSCDLWFFFETIQKCWRPYNGRHYELARRMCDYWSNFIKCGNPNGAGYDGNELPQWKDCDPEKNGYEEMVFEES
ncbi:MAG: carboxylesterase family protein [Lachnospiraceae bacterium]|jgi:carboxylesterase type B|nr:carboxylesterase family protein [Lachnospiraceae bacterium]